MQTPPPIRVAVNDRQLPVVAVLEHGRVLVPLRAIVEALHVHLRDIKLPLRPPARIIAGRWYAPVRAMARLVHARIMYDGRVKLVAVYTTSPQTVAASPAPSAQPVTVRGLEPAANSRVGSAYPTIAASLDLPNGSSIRSLTLLLDGIDQSMNATYQGTFVTYIPRAPLPPGNHTVQISGTSSSGVPFDTSWSFETTQAPPPPDTNTGGLPYYYNNNYVQLTVPGTQFMGGAAVPVELVAPPGGSAFAFICTSSWQYELFSAPQSQFYSGSVPTPVVNSIINCPITAMYVAPNGAVTYAAYPQFVQLLPIATPQPTPTPVPVPTPSRIPAPTPIATRTPAPSPTRTPHPVPTHNPIPRPPIPHPPAPRPTIPPRPANTPAPHRIPLVHHTPKPKPKPTPPA